MNYEELENWNVVYSKMKNEGFHYCFKNYSSFKEIKDKKFHQIRKKYLKVSQELEEYVIKKINESNYNLDYD